MTVKAILTRKGRDVVSVRSDTSLADAAKSLAEYRIGAVLVMDSHLEGILSERDIVRALAARGAAALDQPVEEVMTRKVVTCSERETVGDIMERMTAGKFRHLPVVESGRLVGLVSIGDIVKYRVEEMERESVALREYILTA